MNTFIFCLMNESIQLCSVPMVARKCEIVKYISTPYLTGHHFSRDCNLITKRDKLYD